MQAMNSRGELRHDAVHVTVCTNAVGETQSGRNKFINFENIIEQIDFNFMRNLRTR